MKNKKIKNIILLLVIILTLSSCASKTDTKTSNTVNSEAKNVDLLKIKSLSELSTRKIYYSNVAIVEQKAQSGFRGIGEKNRKAWIKYRGWVKVGVDASQIEMSIDGNNVKVTIPYATITSSGIDQKSLLEDDRFVATKDSWFNKNPITSETELQAINNAQDAMIETFNKSNVHLIEAQEQASELIKQYIKEIGKINGVTYKISFDYKQKKNEIQK